MRLLIARHGATHFNQEYRFTGQFDAPLSALGLRQADALAERLAGRVADRRFDALVSSDLARARQTAERIAARLGQPFTLDPDLREISMGAWEGRNYREVEREQPDLLALVETDPSGQSGAPEGETWVQFSARILGAVRRWRERYPDGELLWVAHGGVISALLLHALELSYERRAQFVRGNTSLFELEYRPVGVRIWRMNDMGHLERLRVDDADEGERMQAL